MCSDLGTSCPFNAKTTVVFQSDNDSTCILSVSADVPLNKIHI